jgi:hypothetical protein
LQRSVEEKREGGMRERKLKIERKRVAEEEKTKEKRENTVY